MSYLFADGQTNASQVFLNLLKLQRFDFCVKLIQLLKQQKLLFLFNSEAGFHSLATHNKGAEHQDKQ
jgi:hypothetical protein